LRYQKILLKVPAHPALTPGHPKIGKGGVQKLKKKNTRESTERKLISGGTRNNSGVNEHSGVKRRGGNIASCKCRGGGKKVEKMGG